MSWGRIIRKAREGKNLSLQALADAIGVSRQAVWQWEQPEDSEHHADPRKHIQQLCQILDLSPDQFYGGSHPDSLVEKVRQLNPTHRAILEAVVDALLLQQERSTRN
jgi:transcriptional regulator with XRE-family HTH domain